MKYLLFLALLAQIGLANAQGYNSTEVSNNCTNAYIDCAGHGTCVERDGVKFCNCDRDYVTHQCAPNVQCCYEKKSRLGAFLLQLFFGEFGAGLFFIGRNFIGGMFMMVFGINIILAMKNDLVSLIQSEQILEFWEFTAFLSILTLIIMWLVYAILIGVGTVNDGEGVPLSKW